VSEEEEKEEEGAETEERARERVWV